MSTSSWWSKKLGTEPQRPLYTPQPQYQQPSPQYPQQQQQQQQPQVTADNLLDAAHAWRGGEATRKETRNCPSCGSDLYFSRTNGGGVPTERGMVTPDPRCYSCGYTEGHQMQGMPTS